MKVKVKVFATLRDKLGWKEKIYVVEEISTVRKILEEMKGIREVVFDDDGDLNIKYL